MDTGRPTMERIVVYGTKWCLDCTRAVRFLRSHDVPFRWVDINRDADGLALVKEVNQGMRSVPTIVFLDGSTLVEPTDDELQTKLGLDG
jgi:mycoredoxin